MISTMRLKIFGFSKLAFFIFSLAPAVTWILFHSATLPFYQWMNWVGFATFFFTLSVSFFYFMLRGVFQARYFAYGVLFLEVLSELLSAVFERRFIGLFGAIFWLSCLIAFSFWLEKRIGAAFLNPKIKWLEGAPQSLPRVKVKISDKDQQIEAEVRVIDFDGFFAFFTESGKEILGSEVSFEIEYQETTVKGEGRVRALFFGDTLGLGLQFFPKDLYHFNQYSSLVQRLRGEGLLT